MKKISTLLITFIVLTTLSNAQVAVSSSKGSGNTTKDAIYTMNNQAVNDCIGILFDSGGENGDYSNNENTTFTIMPSGAQQVKLIVSSWDLKDGDFVSFYDGTSINAPLIETYSSFFAPTEIDANSGAVTIQLISDSAITGAGFRIDWQAVGGTCSPGTTVQAPIAKFNCPIKSGHRPFFGHFKDSSLNNPIGWTWLLPGSVTPRMYGKNVTALYDIPGTYNVSVIVVNEGGRDTLTKNEFITVTEVPVEIYMYNGKVAACKGTLYDDGGIEANYTNNKDYTLVIQPTGATSITMNFSEWAVERNYDVLKIYNGTSTSAPLLGKWSGNKPSTVTANSGAMTLRFTSDGSVNKSGWKATWSSIGGNCGMAIPVTDFSANTTTVTTGSTIQFSDLSTNSPTSWDWSFPGGEPATSTAKNPSVIYPVAGTYSVALSATNAGGTGSKTKLEYITVIPNDNVIINMKNGTEKSCNGTLYDDGGINGKYQNNKTYTLVIQPAGATSITMSFSQWVVEKNYDFLKIYDGASVSDPLLGSWSGTNPGSVTANSGAMTLRFSSDKYVNGIGWKATWSAKGGDCDAVIEDAYRNYGGEKNENGFVIYPNPTSGEFILSMTKQYEQVTVFDITGKALLNIPVQGSEMKIQPPFNRAGLYFIQLKGIHGVKTQKLIVQ